MLAHLSDEIRAELADTSTVPQTLIEGAPVPGDTPAQWLAEVGFWHLPLLPRARHRALVEALPSSAGRVHSDCPPRRALIGAPFSRLEQTFAKIDVFLPATSDSYVFAPSLDAAEALRKLRAHGARGLVLKAATDGAYVLDGQRLFHLPAYPVQPVDSTGAGEAFRDGFLVAHAALAKPCARRCSMRRKRLAQASRRRAPPL